MEDVLGEFLLRTYLENSLPRPQAVKAASGWGGDRFRLLRDDSGRRLFVAVMVWDTTIEMLVSSSRPIRNLPFGPNNGKAMKRTKAWRLGTLPAGLYSLS